MLDVLSVALRAVSFVLLFQAAGIALFVAAFARPLASSDASIRRLGRVAALAALVVASGQYALEPARMAGELAGMFDASLQKLAWSSSGMSAFVFRILGLATVAVGLRRAPGWFARMSVLGAVLTIASFALTGHTSTNTSRWLLAPLLLIHLIIVAFWFGALWPLYLVSLREPRATVVRIIDAFSTAAIWLVPLILLAGSAMAVVLISDTAVLGRPYGELLITKVVLFAALMVFAGLNKWRFTPGIAAGELRASSGFRRSVLAEYVLICGVLAVTAVMTTFFSPE